MCNMTIINTYNNNQIKVADIKKAYILNIIDACKHCSSIKKVVLFGSSLEERCNQLSDIDIAVFGDRSKAKMFRLKSYHKFVDEVIKFGGVNDLQDYDILYFEDGKAGDAAILRDIAQGADLYERN